MQQPADNSSASTFAGVLATLTNPAHKKALAWDDELADDVISLSYERALSTHARYRGAARGDYALTNPPAPEPLSVAAQPHAPEPPSEPQASPRRAAPPPKAAAPAPTQEKHRKDATITIRLSSEECEQLHQRAAEAGLTLSAYLRSCTLEVETLRALVKSTLVQLHAATQPPAQAAQAAQAATPLNQPRFARIRSLLPQRWRAARV